MIKKIIRLGTLLTIKESYLLAKNVLGLGVHPVKTLRQIGREKDRSQQLLVWGLPVYIFTIGLGLMWWERRWLGSISWALSLLLAVYLFFWWISLRRLK
ncbi:MAG: hypothetical protein U0946_00770 [Patescibacteria group bacterium]|nr:hypothetical protein [Patescibacteria group bacterium]